MRKRPCDAWRGSKCGASFLSSLSKFHAAASAVNSLPSWNRAPSRILNVHFVLSAASTL